jgi:uncharacterized SAM-binding protein YcdF (DUF218 family)
MNQPADGNLPSTPSLAPCAAELGRLDFGCRWYDPLAVMMVIVLVYAILAMLTGGRFILEKTLSALIQPLCVSWMFLTGVLISSHLRQIRLPYRTGLWIVWLILVATSTSPLPNWMLTNLEKPLAAEFRPGVDPDLDAIITFGGGVHMGPTRAELGEAGDRVLYAAQLYLKGHTRLLIATGDEGDSATQQIWLSLGVAPEHIIQLAGINTFHEIQIIRSQISTLANSRIGLLSSGYHLPRIMGLAKRAGISNAIPLAANHRITRRSSNLRDFIPSASTLSKFADCLKEWLGKQIGR